MSPPNDAVYHLQDLNNEAQIIPLGSLLAQSTTEMVELTYLYFLSPHSSSSLISSSKTAVLTLKLHLPFFFAGKTNITMHLWCLEYYKWSLRSTDFPKKDKDKKKDTRKSHQETKNILASLSEWSFNLLVTLTNYFMKVFQVKDQKTAFLPPSQ